MFKFVSLKEKKMRRLLLLSIVFLLTFLLCLKLEVPQKVVQVVHRQERLVPIYFVETPEKKVAFSFDASWGAEKTPLILSILQENNLKSTFFLTGFWVEKYPELVKEIAAAGHEIGNHSYSHPHLNNLGEKEIRREVEKVHKIIAELTGKEPHLFRAPFGEYNNKVIKILDEIGYKTIQWSIDSKEASNIAQRTAIATPLLKRILSRTLSNNPKYAKNDTAATASIGKEFANIISTLTSFPLLSLDSPSPKFLY